MWYFAYGSNMASVTLRERRGVTAARALPARVEGWRLVLDKTPLVPGAGAFATLIADPAAHVLGVLYELSADDLAHVELTEGVRIGNYARIEVTAVPLADPGTSVTAASLTSDRRDPALLPTAAYVELLVAGALEHGLPPEWVAWLRTLPCTPDSAESRAQRAALAASLRALRRP